MAVIWSTLNVSSYIFFTARKVVKFAVILHLKYVATLKSKFVVSQKVLLLILNLNVPIVY